MAFVLLIAVAAVAYTLGVRQRPDTSESAVATIAALPSTTVTVAERITLAATSQPSVSPPNSLVARVEELEAVIAFQNRHGDALLDALDVARGDAYIAMGGVTEAAPTRDLRSTCDALGRAAAKVMDLPDGSEVEWELLMIDVLGDYTRLSQDCTSGSTPIEQIRADFSAAEAKLLRARAALGAAEANSVR